VVRWILDAGVQVFRLLSLKTVGLALGSLFLGLPAVKIRGVVLHG